MSEMESLRRGLNPLVLNLQKMELELTCPICLKLLNLPTFLPCNHVSCSVCATSSINGYGCPLCKIPFRYQDLKPATQIEAVVNIYKNLSSTLSSILMQQDQPVETPDGKTPSGKSGSSDLPKDNNFEFEQEKIYNIIGSKLGFLQKCANETEKSKQDNEGSLRKKEKENADVATFIEQKGPCGSQSSEELQRDLDCDSNDLCLTPIVKGLNKREAKVGSGQIGESKKQKITENNAENKIQEEKVNTSSVECGFCHTSEITEATGPILHYIDNNPVNNDKAWLSNALHAHEKCIEWAPQAFFDGDRAMNLEPELVRAAKMKCMKCGLKGAALGCYSKICRRSFHFPCAVETPDCRFDLGNFLMVCPVHTAKKLPSDKLKPKSKKMKHNKSPNLSTNDLSPPVANLTNDLWTSLHPLTKDWLICGSALSKEDKEILDQFENMTGINITNNWESNVTHVIASTNFQGGYSRTLKVLMAILGGKWVLSVDWLKACLKAGRPVKEEEFEINFDVHGTFYGPKTGRLRAKQNAPLLFSEFRFHFSGHYMPYYKSHLEELIFAAGGLVIDQSKLDSSAVVVYSTEPPQGSPDGWDDVINKRKLEAQELGLGFGCRVVAHTWLLDSIAACSLQEM
ncbi:hypothetical protein LUZ60_016300 [Juncus effusus]|nr:hypothetical protein LUZ60_016300 [Juncus effusus]